MEIKQLAVEHMLTKTLAERDEMILAMHNQILDLQHQIEEKDKRLKELESQKKGNGSAKGKDRQQASAPASVGH